MPGCSSETAFLTKGKNVSILDGNRLSQRFEIVCDDDSDHHSKENLALTTSNHERIQKTAKKFSNKPTKATKSQKVKDKEKPNKTKNSEKLPAPSPFKKPSLTFVQPQNPGTLKSSKSNKSDKNSKKNTKNSNINNKSSKVNSDQSKVGVFDINKNSHNQHIKPSKKNSKQEGPVRSARLKIKQEIAQAAIAASQAADQADLLAKNNSNQKIKIEPMEFMNIIQPAALMTKYQEYSKSHKNIEDKLQDCIREQHQASSLNLSNSTKNVTDQQSTQSSVGNGKGQNVKKAVPVQNGNKKAKMDISTPFQQVLVKNVAEVPVGTGSKQIRYTIAQSIPSKPVTAPINLNTSNLSNASYQSYQSSTPHPDLSLPNISHQSRIFKMLEASNIDIKNFIDCVDLMAIQYRTSTIRIMSIVGNANYDTSERIEECNQFSAVWKLENLTRSVVGCKKGFERKIQRWGSTPLVESKFRDDKYGKGDYGHGHSQNSSHGNSSHNKSSSSKSSSKSHHEKFSSGNPESTNPNHLVCRSVIQRIEKENVEFTKKLYHLTWSAIEVRQEVLLKQQQELQDSVSKGRSTRTRKKVGSKRKGH